jgi:hypothetical protein
MPVPVTAPVIENPKSDKISPAKTVPEKTAINANTEINFLINSHHPLYKIMGGG